MMNKGTQMLSPSLLSNSLESLSLADVEAAAAARGSAVTLDGNGRPLTWRSPNALDATPSGLLLQRLTPAEHNVAALVAQGSSNGEIARRLGVSRHTVESHLKHVFVKLGISSRVQLAVLVAKATA
jgi:DNA-binding CsgD family transcriptional regulator